MESKIMTAKIKELADLAKHAKKAFTQSKNDISALIEYLSYENRWLSSLTPNQSIIFNKVLNNDELSCQLLIDDIASLNNRNIIIKRISRKLADLITNSPTENISIGGILLDCLKYNYKQLSSINEKLRYTFNSLCNDKEFLDEQRFIYTECISKIPDIKNNRPEDITYYYDLAKLIIDRLATYNDNELSDISINRIINSYLVLLRSVFIIVDNYDILITFEEYYNQVIKEEKIKNLIKNAFIANYYDAKRLKL